MWNGIPATSPKRRPVSAKTQLMRPRATRNVLFLTYTFPPVRRSGSVRAWNIAKTLARLGWGVTVVTPDPARLRYVEDAAGVARAVEHEGIRRLLTGHSWSWLAADTVDCSNHGVSWFLGGVCRRLARKVGIDRSVGWIRPALQACAGLKADDVDVIFASGPPFAAFPLAQRLSRTLRRPYVLDYRDLWSHDIYDPAPKAIRKEAVVLAGAAQVVTVSPSWASILDREFGVGGKTCVVSNGYDAEYLNTVRPHHFGHFAIVYAGTLFPPKRVVSPVMAALRRIRERRPAGDCRFHYYGPHGEHVAGEARRFGVTDWVVLHGDVSRRDALAAVKGASVAAVITSVSDEPQAQDNGMITGKIFEAVGLRTPTLLIAPTTSDANTVTETTGLGRSYTASDIEGIASFVENLMDGARPESKDPAAYAWDNLVRSLASVLESALETPRERDLGAKV